MAVALRPAFMFVTQPQLAFADQVVNHIQVSIHLGCVQVLAKSLEAQVLQSDNSALAKDCRKEVKAINGQLLKLGRRDHAERRALRSELKALLREERKRQEKAVEGVVSGAQVRGSCFREYANRCHPEQMLQCSLPALAQHHVRSLATSCPSQAASEMNEVG